MESRNLSPIIDEGRPSGVPMRALVVLLVLLLATVPAIAGVGQNESTDLQGTALVSVDGENVAIANNDYTVIVVLEDEGASNGTSVRWTTQICINTGVCYAPKTSDLAADPERKEWTGSVPVDDDASYINWRVDIEWPDGNSTSVPENGFGWKVWSSCWYDTESDQWGGTDVGEDGCEGDDAELVSGFTATIAMVSVAMAGLMSRRD